MPKAKKTHHVASNDEYTLDFSGSVELATLGMPMNTLTDLSDQAPSQVFVTAWIDGNRGKSAHVSFNSSNQETPSTNQGGFRFSLPFRQGDPDLLKMQFCIRMRDTETNNKRSAELYMSYADMNTMLKGHTDRFRVSNQFSPGTSATVQLRISNADRFRNYTCANPDDVCDGPFLHLSKSKIRMIQQMNKLSQQLSKRMQVNLDRNKCQMPPGGAVFIEGLTSRPFSGRINADSGDVECPPLQTHYALMGPQQECLGRFLPPQVVIYHHYLKMVHSGKTGRSILSLPDAEFGQFFLEGMQLTCCPGLWPYEKDFLPQPGLSMTEGLTLTASGTEDLGWPCTESTFCGRHIRTQRPIKVSKDMSMVQLMSLFEQEPLDTSAFRMLVPDVEYMPHTSEARELRNAIADPQVRVLQDLYLQVGTDDCETSASYAIMAKRTSMRLHEQLHADCTGKVQHKLQEVCKGWPIFKNFTNESWEIMADYLDRGNAMLANGELKSMVAVGLASNASASDTDKNAIVSYCGHCFNVSYIKTSAMECAKVGLLEGTAPLYSITVNKTSPKAVIHQVNGSVHVMDRPKFLTCLGANILKLTQVINSPNGGGDAGPKSGWPLDLPITGWLSHSQVMCSLDSDASSELSFYNRIMHIGWACTDQGQGCLPVTERGKITAGCHPFELTNINIRGIDAGFSPDEVSDMRAVMEEATPPMVQDSVLRELASMWIPCRPLESVNTETKRASKLEYHRVSTMESPCAPEYLSIIFEAKRRVAKETNKINDARADSDGIRLYAYLEGLSAVLSADVPYRDISKLTVIESLKTALGNIKYPSYKLEE